MGNMSNWKFTDVNKRGVTKEIGIDTYLAQAYTNDKDWLELYGTLPDDPDPAPILPPPRPSVLERLEAAEALIDMILEAGEEITNG